METNRLIIIVLLSTLLVGCKEYKLSQNDLEWQPYKIGDVLVFESNNKEIDSIEIVDISSYSNPKDQLSPFSSNHETLFVSGKLLNPTENDFYIEVDVLKMYANTNTFMNLNFMKRSDTLEYAEVKYKIKELDSIYKNENRTYYKSLKDVVVFEPNYTGGLDYQYDLNTYWWSKKYGYVRYDFKNGYYWELKKLIRNDKNILDQ